MKISKSKMVRFLELTALKGDIENKESIMFIEKDCMKVILGHPSKTVVICGILNGEFDNIGQVGIDNIPLLLSLLKTFPTNEITITKKKNKLVFGSTDEKLEVSIILREPEYIVNTLENKKMAALLEQAEGNEFTLPLPAIKQILSYTTALGSNKLVIDGNNNVISLFAEHNENSIIADFMLDKEVNTFSVALMSQVNVILGILNKEVEMSMKNDCPISIKVEEDGIKMTYIVAPLKKD